MLTVRDICLAVIFFIFFAAQISAKTSPVKDFLWEKTNDGLGISILKYTGIDKNVDIPPEISGLPVLSITGFANNDLITSVIIPENVISLKGDPASLFLGAFSNCKHLNEVKLPSTLQIIDRYAFSGCSALEKIELPENIVSIGQHSFSDCTALIEITIPPKIREIEWATFCRCTSLKKIDLPDGIKEIDYMAFYGCTALEIVTLPESLVHLGPQAFNNCSSLIELNMLAVLVHFHDYGKGIFSGCTNLPDVNRKFLQDIGYTGSFE
jgi:hypothetical protein